LACYGLLAVLVDGSESSMKALRWALENADKVIAVFLIDERAFKGLNEEMGRALERFMEWEAELLREEVEEMGAELKVIRGEGPKDVMEWAGEKGVDAVVVGVTSVPGFEDVMYQRRIESHVRGVPVLMIPSH